MDFNQEYQSSVHRNTLFNYTQRKGLNIMLNILAALIIFIFVIERWKFFLLLFLISAFVVALVSGLKFDIDSRRHAYTTYLERHNLVLKQENRTDL